MIRSYSLPYPEDLDFVRFGVALRPKLAFELETFAVNRGISRNKAVAIAITEFLERQTPKPENQKPPKAA